jgi:chromosome segregation ATPase
MSKSPFCLSKPYQKKSAIFTHPFYHQYKNMASHAAKETKSTVRLTNLSRVLYIKAVPNQRNAVLVPKPLESHQQQSPSIEPEIDAIFHGLRSARNIIETTENRMVDKMDKMHAALEQGRQYSEAWRSQYNNTSEELRKTVSRCSSLEQNLEDAERKMQHLEATIDITKTHVALLETTIKTLEEEKVEMEQKLSEQSDLPSQMGGGRPKKRGRKRRCQD